MKFLVAILFVVSFFGISFFMTRPFVWGGIIVLLAFTVANWDKKNKFENLVVIYAAFVFMSCLYSYFFNSQPLVKSIESSFYYWGLLSYFIAKGFGTSLKVLKKDLCLLMIICIGCYILQWLVYPSVLFAGAINEFDVNESQFRMRFYCSMLFYLSFLYGINQYILQRKKIYLLYSIFSFIPIIVMGFRSLIGMLVLGTILLIISILGNSLKSYMKYIAFGTVAVIIAFQVPIVQEKIEEMSARQENGGTFDNDDYVRNLGLAYYTANFSEKPIMWLIGGGSPQINPDEKATTEYQRIFSNAYDFHLYWNDLGIIGLSYIIGILSTVLLIYLCIKTMICCKRRDLQYIRFCILVVLIGSIITSMEIYRNGNLVILGILMYIVCKTKSQTNDDNIYMRKTQSNIPKK